MFQAEDLSSGEHKLVTRSKAVVIANQDPQKKGRIRVLHPLLGETGFIPYLSAPGSFSVPDEGDTVYVECDAGYGSHPIAWGNLNSEELGIPDFPSEFQRVNPTNRGFFTPGGHLIELDDGKGLTDLGKGIRITTSGGNLITILEDPTAVGGLITLKTIAGASIKIDGTEDTITASTKFGDSLTLSALGGIESYTPAAGGTTITQNNGQVTINGTVGVKVTDGLGGEVNISEGKVALGGPTAEVLNLFGQVLTQLISLTTALQVQTSLGNLGYPTSVPINAASYAAVQTQLTSIQTLLTTITGSL